MYLQGTPPHIIGCIAVEIVGRAEILQPHVWDQHSERGVADALSVSNEPAPVCFSAGSLHPASCHHQGCVHGLLCSGRQDLAPTFSAQSLWQRLLKVTRLVSFRDKFSFQLVCPAKHQQSPRQPWFAGSEQFTTCKRLWHRHLGCSDLNVGI